MSDLHRFFYPGELAERNTVRLEADTAKHIWQVLRMEEGDHILLTDGRGTIAEGEIQLADKHKCNVRLLRVEHTARQGAQLHLCVAFTKNNARNEWILEKATELGVTSIVPVGCERGQKIHIRTDRWEKILQSAILQSQRNYLPILHETTPLKKLVELYKEVPQKLIAHCMEHGQRQNLSEVMHGKTDAVVLIGPEGDFTKDEVDLCLQHGYSAVLLGQHRLRTETAAVCVAAHYNLIS